MKLSTTYYYSTALVAALFASTVVAAPTTKSSLSIQSPVSGEIYASGQNILIDWKTQEDVLLNVSAIYLGNSERNAIATIVAQDVNSTTGSIYWVAPSNLPSEKELYMIEISCDTQIISTGQFTIQKTNSSTIQPKAVALADPMSGATASASISILGQDDAAMAAQRVATSSTVHVRASMSSGVIALIFAILFL